MAIPNLMMYSSIHLYNQVHMESADTFSTMTVGQNLEFCAMDFKIIIYVVLLMTDI